MSDQSETEISEAASGISTDNRPSTSREVDSRRITVKDVENAIRHMKEPQGATFSMVKNYLWADPKFEGMSPTVMEREVKLAMTKAIEQGKLERVRHGLRFLLRSIVGAKKDGTDRRRRRSCSRRRRGKRRRRRRTRSRKRRHRSCSRRRRRSKKSDDHHHHSQRESRSYIRKQE